MARGLVLDKSPELGSKAEVEALLGTWDNVVKEVEGDTELIASYTGGYGGEGIGGPGLSRLNTKIQDRLTALRASMRELEVLAEEQDSEQEMDALMSKLEACKMQYDGLRKKLRTANFQAKANTEKALLKEREALLGGQEDVTLRRRKLQSQAEMAAEAENITESLRRTRQTMMHEIEHGKKTLSVLEDSNTALRKTEAEYTGQSSLLSTAKGLLSTLRRQDVLDRVIAAVGFLIFLLVCLYVLRKRLL
ncbi:hypothetical protein CBR_g37523 [Chara braunii]|uniref:Sec20 C-terminal domain-containing protein n=1 Tax=Chara braunii TaxID=69332 RepID=A0A388LND6_CHABU|nr:hypothetical protein CBR_g37523 [Chara braunii]|eukprot:GBG83722.1 hypothetical protein CBR_g37523 [Chara braunii]